MASLPEPIVTIMNPFHEQLKGADLAPKGTFFATIIDIKDQFNVTRSKYEHPEQTEVVNLTTFLFGFRNPAENNKPYKIATRQMLISGGANSNLFPLLSAILGEAPKYGWDYCALKGRKVLLTVAYTTKDGTPTKYPRVQTACPIPTGMTAPAPVVEPPPVSTPAFVPPTPVAPPTGAQVPSDVGAIPDDECPF